MATVYLAEDLRHERKVALKVLRPELAAVLGAERFVQEIKTTAALQHPHILPLYDSGSVARDGGTEYLYYVMPYVEGETLREKLDRETQLGVEEAVRITTEVADALDYAHRHGVIHRDIKPENILLPDGRALVADFGIALAVSAAAGGRMTETGLSLGTPHYMSPEQATAEKQITARSDIYSLASVLYEMLAGQPPHLGGSAQQIIMKIIAEPVAAVTALRGSVPPNVAAALAKALQKLPADRFESAKDFVEALNNPAFTTTVPGATVGVTAAPPARSRALTIAIAAAIVFAALAAWEWLRPAPPPEVAEYGLALPADQALQDLRPSTFDLAPDGSLVYVGPGKVPESTQLLVKHPDQYEPTALAGTDSALAPSVSPDGKWIIYLAANQLHRIPLSGGSPITVADSVFPLGTPGVWLGDGTLAYIDAHAGLSRVSSAGGAAKLVYHADSVLGAVPTGAVPDGRGILFKKCELGCANTSDLWVADLRSGKSHRLFPQVAWGGYLNGLLVYVRIDGSVFAVPFDPGELAPRGASVHIFDGVQVVGPYADFAMSPSGSIAYLAGPAEAARLMEAVWVSRAGHAVPVDSSWTFINPSISHGWSLSPDGTQLAIGLQEKGNLGDVWIRDLVRGQLRPLTREPGLDWRPRWTPDGRSVIFLADRRAAGGTSVYMRRAVGTGADSLLAELKDRIRAALLSHDGKWLVLETTSSESQDIVAMHPGVDSSPTPLLTESYNEMEPALSPDGRWLAYVSDESGHADVIVRPFPNVADDRWQISVRGGHSPVWSHSGRELFFVNEMRQMVSQEIVPGPSFRLGAQRALFTIDSAYQVGPVFTDFDISRDDQRFLMVRAAGTEAHAASPQLIMVENWIEKVQRMVRESR